MNYLKNLLFVLCSFAAAHLQASVVDGVELNCLKQAEKLAAVSDLNDASTTAVCRSRQNPSQEHYTYCDGSGCTGFTMTYTKKLGCVASAAWTGQDDGDLIDPVEWQNDCLVAQDFKKVKSARAIAADNDSFITDSSVFQIVGASKSITSKEISDLVGKKIRQSYYQKSYDVDDYEFMNISLKEAYELLLTSEGDFNAISRSELASLKKWVSEKKVKTVVQMDLRTSFMSGSGLENNLIFISSDAQKPVLVVKRFYYAE